MSLADIERAVLAAAPRYIHDPSGTAPLSGLLSLRTRVAATVRITARAGDHTVVVPTKDEPASEHDYPILGLRAARTYTLTVAIAGPDGTPHGDEIWRFTIETPPLPDDLPPIEVTVADKDKMEPGVTLFGVRKSYQQGGVGDYGYIVAVDADGEVVWLRRCGHTVGDLIETAAGTLVYLTFDNRAVELDMLGNVLTVWVSRGHPSLGDSAATAPRPIALDVAALHHEIIELPNGHFVALGAEVRTIDDYPSSETDAQAPRRPARVVGDEIVEFTRGGDIVGRWNLFDILDPYRLCYDSLSGYWRTKGFPDSVDWSHANAVAYLAGDDSFTVSVRHQEAVFKISRETGDLLWIMGTPERWRRPWADKLLTPVGNLDWQFHQHDVRWTDEGALTLFDNGNHRAIPPAAPSPPAASYSRAAEFRIDEAAGTVTQVWEYRGGFSAFISSARKQPTTGNVLINFGGILESPHGGPTDDPRQGIAQVHMVEVAQEAGATPVFELRIDQRHLAKGWDVYRADRIASLYLCED